MKIFKLIAITFGLVFSMEILANPTFSNESLRDAESGDVLAQYNLGWIYANGEGVVQNYEKAFEWYSKAANQGFAMAQYNRGLLDQNGQGVEKDDKKAFELYSLVANQGFAIAQNTVGFM